MRDYLNAAGLPYESDAPQRVMLILSPLTPELLYVAYQTPESLSAVQGEQHDAPREERKSEVVVACLVHPIVTSAILADFGNEISDGARYSRMASSMLARASSSVSPAEAHPGSSGQTAE